MRTFFNTLTLILLSFSLSWDLLAAPADLTIRSEVDKAKMTTSEEVTFTITLNYAPGITYTLPEMGGDIFGMRIINFGTKGPTSEDGRQIFQKWYKLQADVSGSYILPAVEVTYTSTSSSKEQKKIKTSEIFLEVTAPGTKEGEVKDIRDIKNIIATPSRVPPLWVIILILLMLSGLGWGIYVWRKNKARPSIIPPVPPHEKAENGLRDLENGGHLEAGHIKYFHFTLSDIIRNYIEEQFSFPATDLTLEEIREKLTSFQELPKNLKEDFYLILKDTDLVKFTDFTLPNERSLELLNLARKLVFSTKPAVQTAGGGGGEEEESVV